MFRTDEGSVRQQASAAESNYRIQKNDLLELSVFTNRGEKIIDPSVVPTGTAAGNQGTGAEASYLVSVEGLVKFPLLGEIKVEGLTIRQAEELLQKEYQKYYQEPYIVLTFLNKRAIVLGAPGGQVIPLTNENIRLTEVLALAKGIGIDSRATNIRVLRNEEVFVADLSTVGGYLAGNMIIQPGDIIYVEPVRRPVREALRDYGPLISIVTSLGTLTIVIIQANNQN